MNKNYLWKASDIKINNSNINRFSKQIEKKFNLNFYKKFKSLWSWSIENNELFWSEVWDFSNIKGFNPFG